jgi:hypothetical protein
LKPLFRENLFCVIINLIIKNNNVLEEVLNDAELLEVEECKPITATTTISDIKAHTCTPVQSFLFSSEKKKVPWKSKEKEGSVVDLVNQDPVEDGKLVHIAMGRLINTNYFHDNLADNYNTNTNIRKGKETVTPTQTSTQQQRVKPELLVPAQKTRKGHEREVNSEMASKGKLLCHSFKCNLTHSSSLGDTTL